MAKQSRVEYVLDRLVEDFVNGAYPDNVLPPQEVLYRHLDVSRTVLREAVAVLVVRGVLDVRPKTGTSIRPKSEWRIIDEDVLRWRMQGVSAVDFLNDLSDMRRLVEPYAAARAALYASPAQRAVIHEAFRTYRTLLDSPGRKAHRPARESLHLAVIAASANRFVQQMGGFVHAALSMTAPVIASQAMRSALDRLIRAIDARDADSARDAMMAVIDSEAR